MDQCISYCQGQIWTFQDINDIVIRELGVRPKFTTCNIATSFTPDYFVLD